MIEEVKTSLRIKSDALNDDISSDIETALLDMSRVGIDVSNVNIKDESTYDALILSCIKFYCKWTNNFLNRAEEWHKAYITLRDSMSRCGDYSK